MNTYGLKQVTDPSTWTYNEVRVHQGKKYDERSANHNGLTGMGAQLKTLLKKENYR